MSRRVRIRIAGTQAKQLQDHLFPGDGKEAVAFALCGRHRGEEVDLLLVQEVHPIPYASCPVRTSDRVTWKTETLEPLLSRAQERRLGVVKFHSHPTGYPRFSATDDASDRDLFQSIHGWVDDDGPHASVVVLPDGQMLGRAVSAAGTFSPVERIAIAGHGIKLCGLAQAERVPGHAERHAQLFGTQTTSLLQQLSVGVVGCSGTGSFVIEMLARLGVGRLVLVDPDIVEHRNLNRIVGSSHEDATHGRRKVDVLADSVHRMGLGTEVIRLPIDLVSRQAVHALASCDVVFGCMDSHDGRRTLNRLASFYVLPYFDCGVGLEADGHGGIDQVCAASHYLQPGGSTVQSRGIINAERANAEALARRNPDEYARLRKEKYITGVEEDRPAVISVNALAAALVVNEMLERLHHFRDEPSEKFASVRFSFSQMHLDIEPEDFQGVARRELGRGDVEPLLDMPALSQEPVP